MCSQGASHTGRGQHPNTFSSALARDCIPPRQISLPILAWAARSSRVAPVGRDLVVVALVSLFFFFFFFFTLGYLCPSAHTQVIGTRQLPQTLLPGKQCCAPQGASVSLSMCLETFCSYVSSIPESTSSRKRTCLIHHYQYPRSGDLVWILFLRSGGQMRWCGADCGCLSCEQLEVLLNIRRMMLSEAD